MNPMQRAFLAVLVRLAVGPALLAQSVYETDLRHAHAEIGEQCATLIAAKKVDWKAVEKELLPAAKAVKSEAQHLVLLVRLLARLRDGHSEVRPTAKTKGIRWPDEAPGGGEQTGCGMFWCRSGKRIYVKSVWNAAKESGLEPGMEVLSVDGTPVAKWLDARMALLRDTLSYSSDVHAFFDACHAGLRAAPGTRLELELKELDGKKKKRTVTYAKAALGAWGPAVFPPGLESTKDLHYGRLASGYGYIHLRRSPETLPEQLDAALAAMLDAPGLILDYRGNSGGGFDHQGFLGRFVPPGSQLPSGNYVAAGPRQYGGPVVVIVDGTVKSAGETGAGQFKEDGRGYLIGESPTAGMASQKTTIALPSGLFELYVSTHSNKARFNNGRGIEGVGVIPHELVEFDPKDLAAGRDTLILRAEALLAKFPADKVPFQSK
jgi:carboxyl-terminal processing protease